MLKLEKIGRTQEIKIGFKKKSNFFNKNLLQALAIAVVMHFSCFLIFHIGPFKIMQTQILPPAEVETDIFEEASTIAKIETENIVSRFSFAPKIKGPEFPKMVDLNLTDFAALSEECNFLDNPFLNLENDIQMKLYFSKEKKDQDLKVVLSGDLANRKYEVDLSPLQSLKKVYATYSIKVENKTGRIFWIDPNVDLDEKLNEKIKNILKEIRFETSDHGFLTSGGIEFR